MKEFPFKIFLRADDHSKLFMQLKTEERSISLKYD